MAEEYYYAWLGHQPNGKVRQQTYHLMKQGIESLLPSFAVPRLSGTELSETFTLLMLDHPEIFYAPSFTYRFYSQADSVDFIPEYLFKKKEIQEHQKAIASRLQKLVRPALSLDEWGKEQYVHDFICQSVRYDKLKKAYSHEIIGPLTQGVGVCEGIAKTVKVLLDALGVPCLIAFCHNDPEKGVKYRHAWNIVRIGGHYYHLDATFDNSLTKASQRPEKSVQSTDSGMTTSKSVTYGPITANDIRYDYFNVDDKAIFRDHQPLVWPVPACPDHSRFYYLQKKLSFTKLEDVQKRALQSAKKNRVLTFHWRGGYLTREVLHEICILLEEVGISENKDPILSLNWPQAVLRVRFDPIASDNTADVSQKEDIESAAKLEDKITFEESNEGEQDSV